MRIAILFQARLQRALALAMLPAICFPLAANAATAMGKPTPPAFPLKPITLSMGLNSDHSIENVGPASGTMGITSITLVNGNSTQQNIILSVPTLSTPICGNTVTGTNTFLTEVLLAPQQNLQLNFPTPMVINQATPSCIAAQDTSTNSASVLILVNGFVQ